MNKNTFTKVTLGKGEMHVYDFGNIKLHAYKTNDFIDDEVFILEKDGQAVLIESPCFFDNNQELTAYLEEKKLQVAGMLLAYHMAGGAFLPQVKKYATKNADEYGHTGGGADLVANFTNAFGDIFDNAIHTVTDYLEEGEVTIGGIKFVITKTAEAFDIFVPEINVVYTHMLGHDCHSIVAGAIHGDSIISQLKAYIDNGVEMILTSHYTPEDLKDAAAKIAYIEDLKVMAAAAKDGVAFKKAVQEKYPNYSGENYLDMTAGMFFQN